MTPRCNRRRFVSPLFTKFDFPPLADALAGFSIDIGAALATGMVRPIWCDAANIGNFVNYRIIVGGITDGQTPDQFLVLGHIGPQIPSCMALETTVFNQPGQHISAKICLPLAESVAVRVN